MRAMRKDVDFLKSMGIMDYSLLMAIEKKKPEGFGGGGLSFKMKRHISRTFKGSFKDYEAVDLVSEKLAEKHRYERGNKIYHIAIIDYLQEWNFSKKAERVIKTTFRGKDGKTLSAIEPVQYAERFKRFMERNVFL